MDYDYSELLQQSQQWAQQVLDHQGLDTQVLLELLALETQTQTLDNTALESRPIIVAFMGGTGVGKSSLLNRLVGQALAKTGIERPTSREISLYYHQSHDLQNFPALLSSDTVKRLSHSNPQHKNIIWVDMPDFDSVEHANKQLVLQWLPQIDVLIYVVSPERYRDQEAWKLLLSEGQKHGWVFVFNQWDLAQPEQYQDFESQLSSAGFQNPFIFRSSCEQQSDDEFLPLLAQIESLATHHTLQILEQRTIQLKKQALKQQLQTLQAALKSVQNYPTLKQQWQQQWTQAEQTFTEGFEWKLAQQARQYAEKDAHLLTHKKALSLWDPWAQNRLDESLDQLILNADHQKLITAPLRKNLQIPRQKISAMVNSSVELNCRQALVTPGNSIHRLFLKISHVCELFLPLITMGFVGYQLFLGFYNSAETKQAYLGLDFAIHSVLFIAISWLLPYFIRKKMQPSIEKSALKGLKKGLKLANQDIRYQIDDILENLQQQQQQWLNDLSIIIDHCHETKRPKIRKPDDVARILLDGDLE
ncbi:MAG: 50S ribosome-binding GTPase [Methylococcales bacterium]|nr:50S ribosome-binding GTPase [Methylococcales bacterium]